MLPLGGGGIIEPQPLLGIGGPFGTGGAVVPIEPLPAAGTGATLPPAAVGGGAFEPAGFGGGAALPAGAGAPAFVAGGRAALAAAPLERLPADPPPTAAVGGVTTPEPAFVLGRTVVSSPLEQ